MKDLIEKISTTAGITEAQAELTLATVKEYVKEKFPMMAGAVDKLFETTTNNRTEEDYL